MSLCLYANQDLACLYLQVLSLVNALSSVSKAKSGTTPNAVSSDVTISLHHPKEDQSLTPLLRDPVR